MSVKQICFFIVNVSILFLVENIEENNQNKINIKKTTLKMVQEDFFLE